MSLEEQKEELLPIIAEKIEQNILPKFIRRKVEDEDGRKHTEQVPLTDPREYLEHLIEKKKIIKGNIYSDEYYLNAVKKEDLQMTESEDKVAPQPMEDLKINQLKSGIDNFCVKGRVVKFNVRSTDTSRGPTRIATIHIADETGNWEVNPIWYDSSRDEIFEAIDNNEIVGRTIYLENVRTTSGSEQSDKYSPFPFIISPRRQSVLRFIDEEVEGDIQITKISDLGENTPCATVVGKLYKVFDEQTRNWTSPKGKNVIFRSQDAILMGESGSTITLKTKSKAAGHLPEEGSFVMIQFAKVVKDNYRVENNYPNPFVIEVYNKSQIKEVELDEEEAASYPEKAGFKGVERDLYEADLNRVTIMATLSDLRWEKWDDESSSMVPRKPYYIACNVDGCRKKVDEVEGVYSCPKHQVDADNVKKRFMCNVIVRDYTNEFKALISGDLIEKIFGRTEEMLIEDYDAMEHDGFFSLLNDQISLDGNLFLIKGNIQINSYGVQFNINDAERMDYEEAVDRELAKIVD